MGKGYSWLVLFIFFSQNSPSSFLRSPHTVQNKFSEFILAVNVFYRKAFGETHLLGMNFLTKQ